MKTLLEVKNVSMEFDVKQTLKDRIRKEKKKISAVHDVSLAVYQNEVLSLVGESGCGKSTLAKIMIQLLRDYEGTVLYENDAIDNHTFRTQVQMVFQDPYSCLNPKKKVRSTLLEVLNVHNIGAKEDRLDKVKEMLQMCGLQENVLSKYPSELSGGQCQRIGIARALLTNPKLVIADEPISALDVSVQAQIINMLLDLKEKMNLTVVFISHDLEIVKYLSDRIAVMYLGEIVEIAEKEELFKNPLHPYTRLLLSCTPQVFKEKDERDIWEESDMGEMPNITDLPIGCRFQTRCPHCHEKCRQAAPELVTYENNHQVACYCLSEKEENYEA